MSLNDTTLEGDYYNTHNKVCTPKDNSAKAGTTAKDYHDFDIVANTIAAELFNTKPLTRRIYESVRNTIRYATSRTFRKRR